MRSLLFLCLFFGLICMILPRDRKGQWIRLLLIVVMFLSLGNSFRTDAWEFLEMSPQEISVTDLSPQKIALHNAVSSRVAVITGSVPHSVESDLECEESVGLTFIRVVLSDGDCEEVLHDLSRTFSFEGFIVTKE